MDTTIFNLRYLTTADGKVPVRDWLLGLDKANRARIEARLARVRNGNFGDYRDLGGDILELRMTYGSGYRIYFTWQGKDRNDPIILLCGGDKGSQQKDIDRARRLHEELKGSEND